MEQHEALQLRYVHQVGVVQERFQEYLEARINDPASEAVSLHSSRHSNREGLQFSSRHPILRSDDVTSNRAQPSQLTSRAAPRNSIELSVGLERVDVRDGTDLEMEQAERDLQRLILEVDDGASSRSASRGFKDIVGWCDNQRRWISPEADGRADSLPDEWIDLYSSGRLLPIHDQNLGSRSSVRADLELYYGKALDWFCWIDLFRALVHDSNKSAGEKLALLKRHLRGDCADIVHGLGGGEAAYIEALTRLKQTCGRRDVMRAAHLQAIDKLELKHDPSNFKRYAEKLRTHLFDLSWIGVTSSADLIERVCQRLQLQDRLAWNMERRGEVEDRTLNSFGSWLCVRASAYQNAYSIAADQLPSPSTKTNHRHQVRSHQSVTKTQTEVTPPKPRVVVAFCFRCEKEHRLAECEDFKTLSVGDRVGLCAKHRLCFSCLGSKHSARDCNYRKACKFEGCKYTHHPLLHDFSSGLSESARNNTLRAAQPARHKIAMRMIRLEIIAADGTITPTNVFVDEGSDTPLMRQGLASRLSIRGPRQVLEVDGAGGVVNRYSSQKIEIQMRSTTGETFKLLLSTLPQVAAPTPKIDWLNLKHRWAHLSDLPVKETGGPVDVLIGMDYGHLLAVLESRYGGESEPIASRTRLGWILRRVIDRDSTVTTAKASQDKQRNITN
ncbi:uncharacterized protein LOC130687793 [Daphnia carinata]|uniref:uncharacterized protein LOC130687793 n=1 Tax=Daphnia carinata TaxID=120202 RepID=UPI0025796D17|nr:uncharacterized protein LOC130687793 [Daphnia carinata]